MQNLIQELLNPQTSGDGLLIPPSTVKRRAAEAIKQLHMLQQQDLQGRLSAQADAERNLAQAVQFHKLYGPSDHADQYQEAMNKDQYESFN